MHRVGRPQLARLNNESQKARSQRQEKERVAQPSSNTRGHRLDVNTVQLSGCTVQVNAWRGKIEQTNPRDKKEYPRYNCARPTDSPAHTIECVSGPNLFCWAARISGGEVFQ